MGFAEDSLFGWHNKRIAELEGEVERLERWVQDLQSGMYINCVYCGHRYGPAQKTPVSMAKVLHKHIEQCPKHPLAECKTKNTRLREALLEFKRAAERDPFGLIGMIWEHGEAGKKARTILEVTN